MRNKNKKGFTLVELVIVIAVIAILAAVLIPTFVTVIANANKSAALQEATNLRDQITVAYAEQGGFDAWCKKAIESTSVDGITKVEESTSVTVDITKITINLTAKTADAEALPLDEIVSKDIKSKKETDATKNAFTVTKSGDNDYSITYVVGDYSVTISGNKVTVTK